MATKILVCDDSDTQRELILSALRTGPYALSSARDGEDCINKAKSDKPAVIVLDVIMPDKNGYEVCRALKKDTDTADIKILLLTTKNQDTDRFWGMKQGADAYMTKPFENEALLATIKELT